MKLIPLTQGKFAKVSDHRFEFLNQWKWSVSESRKGIFYAVRKEYDKGSKVGTNVFMHRLILNVPKGLQVDHIDCDTLNNEDENIRICTPSQNQMNQPKDKRDSSKYKGVYWNKKYGRFYARITLNGKLKFLGSFVEEKDAAIAYNNAAIELHKEFAVLNTVI